jgi:hypothetical protein
MKAIIITKALIEEREFSDLGDFIEMLKRRFNFFLISFEFNKEYDLVVLAE